MILISVDPGLNGTGWAIFNSGKKGISLLDVGVITDRKSDSFQKRGENILKDLEVIMDGREMFELAVEFPSFFQSSHGEMVARRGDLVKLAWFVGVISGAVIARDMPLRIVEVNEWKGQLKKDVVIRRIERKFPEVSEHKIKTHAWDAVGIGLYCLGKF
jgi:Holliday junction resolvasome RuvABC endonuclease subunit